MDKRGQGGNGRQRPGAGGSGTLLALLFVLLFCTCVRAQKTDNNPNNLPDTAIYEYPVRTITVRDGLSRNQLRRVWEDQRGFVWLFGKRGLDRFDGLEVVPFQSDSTMSSEVVTSMAEDDEGNMWFVGPDALFRYDGSRFDRKELPAGRKVIRVSFLNGQPILFVSHEDDLFYFQVNFPLDTLARIERLHDGFHQSVYTASEGSLYVATMSPGPDTLSYLPLGVDAKNKTIRVAESIYLPSPMLPLELQRVIINDSIFVIRKGEMTFESAISIGWVPTGYLRNSPCGPIIRGDRFVQLLDAPFSILYYSRDFVGYIHHRKDRLLIAAEEGLVILRPESPVLLFPAGRGMASDTWSILEGADAGAEEGGGAKFFFPFNGKEVVKLENGHYKRVALDSPHLSIYYPGATQSKAGTFLIPTADRVFRFDPTTEQFTSLDAETRRETNDILETGNRIYAATSGLALYENDRFIKTYGDEDGLDVKNLDFLESINEDRDGRLWLGSHNGLAVREPDGTFRNYRTKEEVPSGIVHGTTDQRGNLWFATHDGIAFYGYTDTLPRWVTPDFHEDVKFVHVIDSTWLLIGGVSKLYLLDLKKFYGDGSAGHASSTHNVSPLPGKGAGGEGNEIDIYPFDEDDGFPAVEPLQASVMEDSEKIIWIGTTDGVVRLDPSKIKIHKEPTEPHFHSFGWLDESGEHGQTVVVPFNENGNQSFTVKSTDQNIDIRFFTINHDKPHSMRFRYRLVGYRESWSPPSPVRTVNYGELPPGDYTFELQACLFGNCTETKSLQLRVTPARFWEYPVTKAGTGALLLLLFGTLAFQVYTRRRERQKAERQAHAFEMERIETRRKLTVHKIGPHFANNALTAISDLIIREENETARKYTSHFASLFRPVLEDSLGLLWTLAEELAFIDDYLELEELRFGRKMRYEVLIAPELEEEADDILVPSLLIQSFVNNAVKHGIEPLSAGGLVQISLARAEKDYLLATITDNGPGIDPDDLREDGTGISSAKVMLEYLNQYTTTNSSITFIPVKPGEAGTIVHLKLYLHHQLIN